MLLGAIFMVHWPRWSFVANESHPMGGMEFQVLLLGVALFLALVSQGEGQCARVLLQALEAFEGVAFLRFADQAMLEDFGQFAQRVLARHHELLDPGAFPTRAELVPIPRRLPLRQRGPDAGQVALVGGPPSRVEQREPAPQPHGHGQGVVEGPLPGARDVRVHGGRYELPALELGEIRFFPARPASWTEGSIRGLSLRGDITLTEIVA